MKIHFTRHKHKYHPKIAGSWLLTATSHIRGKTHGTAVFVHERLPEESARKQIKKAFRKFRDAS